MGNSIVGVKFFCRNVFDYSSDEYRVQVSRNVVVYIYFDRCYFSVDVVNLINGCLIGSFGIKCIVYDDIRYICNIIVVYMGLYFIGVLFIYRVKVWLGSLIFNSYQFFLVVK